MKRKTEAKKAPEAKPETLVKARAPALPEGCHWSKWDKVVRGRSGDVDVSLTNAERAKRGLPTPWSHDMLLSEQYQPGID